jgi:hypothetical protein
MHRREFLATVAAITGATALPKSAKADEGTVLEYNGVRLTYCKTNHYWQEPAGPEGFRKIVIDVQGITRLPPNNRNFESQQIRQMLDCLQTPRKHLVFLKHDVGIVAHKELPDRNNGPRPLVTQVLQTDGGAYALVRFAVKTWL